MERRGGDVGLSIGIDVGGTFTDLVAVSDAGEISGAKVSTTPGDPSIGVLAALRGAGSRVSRIAHGTTAATNTLLQRNGAAVVLCATEGVTDLLELRRQERASLYDLAAHHPPSLVPQTHIVAVAERVMPEGIRLPLTEGAAARAASAVAALRPDVVAIALLHSYGDPSHERRLRDAIVAALPGTDIVLSSDVLPEIREYERCATTVAEAYLRPSVSGYLGHLAERLGVAGYPDPLVMTSSGGMLTLADASRSAASLALSGPAGGVTGAALVLKALGIAQALTIDIGGTSADVGLVLEGRALSESGGAVAGVPIALPRVLIETVSAGGGSVAWVDDGGALRVGPRSAGARPGPAGFGRGGSEATVTDAHVVLQHMGATSLGDGVALDVAASAHAVGRLATLLGATVSEVAAAIIEVADAEMARALRRVSVERGIDPAGCVLVAFGGGGPLHACALAELLAIRRILVPPRAGVLSALGLALAPMRRDALGSLMRLADSLDRPALQAALPEVAGMGETTARCDRTVRARYVGQGHELDVPVGREDDGPAVASRFAALHMRRFGFALDRAVELVSARSTVTGPVLAPTFARRGRSSWDSTRRHDDGRGLDATVHGHATITLPDATMLVQRGWTARALEAGGWMMEAAE
ncbi:MAG: hydantoinase/oxoprolinase family protein [Gemmatimonadaceae bacterium]